MLVPPYAPLAFLLTTRIDPIQLSEQNCLSRSYYGAYGGESLFILNNHCRLLVESILPQPLTAVRLPSDKGLVFIYASAVDEAIATPSLTEAVERLGHSVISEFRHESLLNDQLPITQSQDYRGQPAVLHYTNSSAILALDHSIVAKIDTIIPPFFKAVSIPPSPIPLLPVPSDAIEYLKHLLSTIKFDPEVASIVNNISVLEMRNDIRYLTGEDSRSPILSRHSFSEGSQIAAAWLAQRFEDAGAKCELRKFLSGFSPNVICRYPSIVDTNRTTVISAHYDSRGSFGSTRHPGGNDDGSGVTALLSIAHVIARKRISFDSHVELVAFSGEEQGLLGSKAYARDLQREGTNITIMIQGDMLAYHAEGEPPQLGLPEFLGTPEATQLVSNMSAIYSPELTVGFTPACCSDHQSFHEQGFPATQVYERAGPIVDPMYHNSGDLSDRDGFDFYQLRSITKIQMASLLHAAGYHIRDY